MDSNEVIGSDKPAAQDAESAGQESFAELLAKSSTRKGRLSPGERVKAKVVGISGETVYIDLGGKSEGIIDAAEFKNESGDVTIKEGDQVDAFFVTVVDGAMKMTTLVRGQSSVKLAQMRSSFESSEPVTGEVKREIKGGFEVFVDGIKGFCPFSQIDLKGGREGGLYVGRSFQFKIIEFKENGRTIVLSRRVLLKEEKAAAVNKLKESLAIGMDVTGKISSLQNFGAFVDMGGIEGLIPASEISWAKNNKPGDFLSVGQEVTAKLISIDWEKNRLTLSLKSMQPDPWEGLPDRYPVGSRVSGPIVRLTPFGAFVNLEPGIDGLVHLSNLGTGKRINHPKEVVETGQMIEVYILAVDPQTRKISLSVQPKVAPKKIVYPAAGEVIDGAVEKVMPFGVFVKIGEGLTGLVPNSEMGTPRGSDHSKSFLKGDTMKVLVMDVDTDNGKVTLSRKGVLNKEEEDDLKSYRDTVAKGSKSESGLSSFGELLKARLEEKGIRAD
ncbi:MAG TPA: S1 RNA-binding domain-containing protein [Dissulfurispiraceae bacterium]|nr:S1 RNA-binding domain-containing protein [Dissulfurispiraceae bacterium]